MSPPCSLRTALTTAGWLLVATVAAFIAVFQDTPLLNRSILASRVELDPSRMTPLDGHAFKVPGLWFGVGDQVDRPRSAIALFEDDRPLEPRAAPHASIRDEGRGAWSHWTRWIIFSSSDGSDPRSNGRRYSVVGLTAPVRIGSVLVTLVALGMMIRSLRRLLRGPRADGTGEERPSAGTTADDSPLRPPSRGRRRLLVAATLLVCVALLSALVVSLEVMLRIAAAPSTHATLHLSAPLGWERADGLWRIVPPEVAPRDDSFRVLLLGDSFTHDRTWGEKTIRALRDLGLEVVGAEAGASGYGTTQALMVLDRFLQESRPDAVILQFYAWNDPRDNWPYPAICYNPRMVHRPYMGEHGEIESPSPWSTWIRSLEIWRQLLEPLLDPMRSSHAAARLKAVGIDGIAERRERVVVDFYDEASWTPFYRPSRQDGAYVTGAWRITERALRAIRDRCRDLGIPLIVVALDAPFTVDDVTVASGALRELVREDDWDPDLPMRRIGDMASSLGVPRVDLTAALRARRNRLGGAAQYDGQGLGAHLLPDAEEVFAETLVPLLEPMIRDRQPRRR